MCTSEMCSSYAVVVTVARKFVSHNFSGLTRVRDEFPGKSQAMPSKHARSISITASYGHHSQRAAKNWPDPIFCIWFGSVLLKVWIILCKGKVWAKCIWSRSKPACNNHWARFWQNATGLLSASCFKTQMRSSTHGLDHIEHTQKTDPIWFWLTVSGCDQVDQIHKQVGMQDSFCPPLANAFEPDRIQHAYCIPALSFK